MSGCSSGLVSTLQGFNLTEKHFEELKVPYFARFALPVFSNNNICLWPLSELPRNVKSVSFSPLARSTFQKIKVEINPL